jgi:peroxiredoxin
MAANDSKTSNENLPQHEPGSRPAKETQFDVISDAEVAAVTSSGVMGGESAEEEGTIQRSNTVASESSIIDHGVASGHPTASYNMARESIAVYGKSTRELLRNSKTYDDRDNV